ncbi:substrate-binding domain-containing protein [Kitasatospora sp. NPDC101183]|uniref:substrate-binding domain-containing protein n=1 Tax=Kitasatospora sp. NPDC101183 TaxID=3364100 RepID=UPI0037F20D0A
MSADEHNGPKGPEDAPGQEQQPVQDPGSRPDGAQRTSRDRTRTRDMTGSAPLTVFAKGLLALREEAGMTLAELAKATGYAGSTMSKVTSTTMLCSEHALLAYVSALGGDRERWHAEWKKLDQMTAAQRTAVPDLPAGDETAAAAPADGPAEAPITPGAPPPSAPQPTEPTEPGRAVAGGDVSPPPRPTPPEAEQAGSGEPVQAAGPPEAPMPGPVPQEKPVPLAAPTRRGPSWLRPVPAWPRRPLVPAALAAVTAVAVAATVLWPSPGGSHGRSAASPSTATAPAAPALPECSEPKDTLTLTASPDFSATLTKLAADYGARTAEGQCLQVKVTAMSSGSAAEALRNGWTKENGRPDVWSPASKVWLPLARQSAAANALPTQDPPSIAATPLVIAMPEPMATALGWPGARITWKNLAEWAQDPKNFWARHGHADWGSFLLGKTDPRYSTSGLNAIIAAFASAAATTTGPLAPDKLTSGNIATDAVRGIEQSVVHYGDTTLTFLANLRRANDAAEAGSQPGSPYISAVAVEESAVVAYNRGYPCGTRSDEPGCEMKAPPKTKLVAFYPADATFYSDHPYITLTGISPQKKALADDFLAYLHSGPAQDQFGGIGLRSYDSSKPKPSVINRDNGALPDAPLKSVPLPGPEVLGRILSAWPDLRKRANVLLVIDTSGSMNDKVDGTGPTKLELLKQAAPELLKGFADQDSVGLWQFSTVKALKHGSDHNTLVDVGLLGNDGSRRAALNNSIQSLTAAGGTALYQTTTDAVKELRDHRYAPDAINAVVLLTDGSNDNDGAVNPDASLDQLMKQLDDPKKIRVFTIGYGIDPVKNPGTTQAWADLQAIADRSQARAYRAEDPKTIAETLTNVISNF